MELIVWLIVIISGGIHASWNALIKSQSSPIVGAALVQGGVGVVSCALIPFFGWLEPEALPYLIISVIIHTSYILTLAKAYGVGNFGQVYPLVRGSAPLFLIALLYAYDGSLPDPTSLIGIAFIVAGLLGLALRNAQSREAVLLALATGFQISLYFIVDAWGAQKNGTPDSYILWMLAIHGLLTFALIVTWKGTTILAETRTLWPVALLGGGLSLLSYWIILWAFHHAPIPIVASLRETSLIFALLISVIILKEKITKQRIIAALFVAIGALLLRWL